MDSSEATLARERCSDHPDRAAVGRCGRCRRAVCLECAIPFRGGIRCERCAALELGVPEPVPAPRRRLRAEVAVVALALVAAIATVPPWHRSGTLTSALSAWNLRLDPRAALACASAAIALVALAVAVARTAASGRALVIGSIASATAAVVTGVVLALAPGFFSFTPAPFLVVGASTGTAVLGGLRALRGPRP